MVIIVIFHPLSVRYGYAPLLANFHHTKVLKELAGYRELLIRLSLLPEQEAKLEAVLAQAHAPSLSDGVERLRRSNKATY